MGRGTLTPQEEELKKIISNNIRNKINEEGISQAEFSRRSGIPPTTLSGYVKGVTRPNAANLQKISDTFGILKSDIDPSYKKGYSLEDWKRDQINPTKEHPIIDETIETMKQLDESRQQVVLATANVQLKEQNDSKAKVIPMKKKSNILTDEALQEAVDTAVAFDGIPLNEQEKEAAKALIRRFWEEDHPED
ncbi:helix-turn-helix domain-containing protein [Lactococcus formosensis]|uniref:helix-turn-helix domain-containing protein n=1 Tax=Lactococcus formosensis TaxID=1281486 RepID=UPI00288F3A3B|nr:helix-turn-helix transcriptional regulator [Lactococcus formosensis]MDT2726533.1 helix-turn-helix transcriptional regulator [Lactococcus formosensis]